MKKPSVEALLGIFFRSLWCCLLGLLFRSGSITRSYRSSRFNCFRLNLFLGPIRLGKVENDVTSLESLGLEYAGKVSRSKGSSSSQSAKLPSDADRLYLGELLLDMVVFSAVL